MSSPRTSHPSKLKIARRCAIVLAILAAGVACAWGLQAYLGMVELHVRVADSCSRLEAMGRSHAELANNLVRTSEAFECLGSAQLADIMGAVARAENLTVSTANVDDLAEFEEFREAHGRLAGALAGAWSAVKRSSGREALIVVEDLEVRSRDLTILLDDGMQELERNLDAYRSAARRFPGSVVMAVAKLDARTLSRSPARQAAAGTPGSKE